MIMRACAQDRQALLARRDLLEQQTPDSEQFTPPLEGQADLQARQIIGKLLVSLITQGFHELICHGPGDQAHTSYAFVLNSSRR
jgi:hypothetical protein